ncbi:hypothetical protein INT43_003145 [Umbelopsis isabellina]|uniref:RRM Nup35-type domain-containing protein n=1 Tax=Mortierella isabellina TaxID=91625 RepID=A0A8H7PQ68_MORIS|nr:hypothetical protein INT43_003145 [Umbelopsis isabellina]
MFSNQAPSNQGSNFSSMFGTPAASSASAFGTAQAATTTPAPQFGNTANKPNSLFGNASTTTAGTPSLFGGASAPTSSAPTFNSTLSIPGASGSFFGAGASTTTTPSPFGTSTATTKPSTTPAPLFGANTTSTASTGFSFGGAAPASTPAPFSAAPATSTVDTKTVSSDSTVPHYTIGPHSIMRQTAPPPSSGSSFIAPNQKVADAKPPTSEAITKSENNTFQDKRTVLPGFLTSAGSSSKLDSTSQAGNEKSIKSMSTQTNTTSSGLFGTTGQDYGYGSRSLAFDASDDSEAPPMLSMWDIGVQQTVPNTFPVRPLQAGLSWNLSGSTTNLGSSNINPAGGMHANTEAMQSKIPAGVPVFGQSSFGSSNNEIPTSYTDYDKATINVCGFPPSMTSYILDHFRQYGDIIDYRNSGSNWMTITYSTRLSAQKALSRNGKIIGGNCMIGVSPANQQNVFGSVTSPEMNKDDKTNSQQPMLGRPIQVDRTGQIWRPSGLGSGRAGPSATNANGQNNKAAGVFGGVIAHAKDALFAW